MEVTGNDGDNMRVEGGESHLDSELKHLRGTQSGFTGGSIPSDPTTAP